LPNNVSGVMKKTFETRLLLGPAEIQFQKSKFELQGV